MSWNNRVIRRVQRNPIKKGEPEILHYYDVHEVFYRKNGKPYAWTQEPIIGGFETKQDLLESLSEILRDAIRTPVAEIRKKGKKEILVDRKGT